MSNAESYVNADELFRDRGPETAKQVEHLGIVAALTSMTHATHMAGTVSHLVLVQVIKAAEKAESLEAFIAEVIRARDRCVRVTPQQARQGEEGPRTD